MTKLQREVVVKKALDLLNEVGADGLTTRLLAERLGVKQPALYWHFASKRTLFDALAAAMLDAHHDRSLPAPGEDWRRFLIDNARSFRRTLLTYRDGARIHAGSRLAPRHADAAEAQLRLLHEAGFDLADAVHALLAIGHYVVGSVLEQQAAAGAPAPQAAATAPPPLLAEAFAALSHATPDDTFELGLKALVDGLAARLSS